MRAESPVAGRALMRALCLVILLILLAALVYAAWIGISNFSRIHV